MRVITLLTDFGRSDAYAGVLHGVILRINPHAVVVDLCHEIPAHDVRAAAFVLFSAYRFFPEDAIHVAVVDPGVGTERRAMAVRTGGGVFISPDNGLLSRVLDQERALEMVQLTNPAYWLSPLSSTFHGRDLFASVAAHLSIGVPLSAMGPGMQKPVLLKCPCAWRDQTGVIHGEVQHVDRFGNLITNIPGAWVEGARGPAIKVAGEVIRAILDTYASVADGTLLALVGSSGFLEIAVRSGSAAERLGVSRDAPVHVHAQRAG